MPYQLIDWNQNMAMVEGSALVITGSVVASQTSFEHGATPNIGSVTASRLIVTSTPAKRGVVVKATSNNPGTVYIGNSDVTGGTGSPTDGFELNGGESVTLDIDNANKVYAIAGSGITNRVSWMVV